MAYGMERRKEMTLNIASLTAISLLGLLLVSEAFAFDPFSKEELEALDSRLQEISRMEGGKRETDEIWADMKNKMLSGEEKGLYFQPHKLNYFILNGLPGDPEAQVKFQISAKYQVFEGSLNIFRRNYFPLYMSYTQKSFWNIGQTSAPFEENNYNPEIFLDYPIPGNPLKLSHIVLSGEHESNGRDGAVSRSWNRLYVLFSFGVEARDGLKKMGTLHKEKYKAYLKLWEAYGTEDQDDYLKSIGRDEKFLDYAGKGEIGFSIRELPFLSRIEWFKNNQLDFMTRIFRDWDKESYEIGYHQNVPGTNFFVYVQYWNGFGESLQRFDKRDSKLKGGLSFFF